MHIKKSTEYLLQSCASYFPYFFEPTTTKYSDHTLEKLSKEINFPKNCDSVILADTSADIFWQLAQKHASKEGSMHKL